MYIVCTYLFHFKLQIEKRKVLKVMYLSEKISFSKIILINRLIQHAYISKTTRSFSTVDKKEIKHHNTMKTYWWDKDGTVKLLHKFNPFRVQFVREGMANTGFETPSPAFPLKGLKIIDVGCGGGILTESLARVGAEVTGLDASDELIEVANQHIKSDPDIMKRVHYISTNIEEFSKTNIESYDVVVCSEVLEHVADPDLFIKKCVEVLKPDGSIFITTINRTLCSWLGAIIVAEYMLKLIPFGTHQWNKFISPYEVQSILDKYGCKTKLLHGILVNPLTYHFKWSSYTGISYGLHAVKQTTI